VAGLDADACFRVDVRYVADRHRYVSEKHSNVKPPEKPQSAIGSQHSAKAKPKLPATSLQPKQRQK
jgi:hypothetical protein